MKKTNHPSKEHQSFRRSVRKLFTSLLKRQGCACRTENQRILELLREIEASIEVMAREMARQAKRNERNGR